MRDSGASEDELYLTWNIGIPMLVVRPRESNGMQNETPDKHPHAGLCRH